MDADIDSGEGTIEAVDEPADNDEFRLELLTLAEWALIAPDGRISLGNALTTTVQVAALPGGLPPLYLVASVAAPAPWAGHQASLTVRAVDAEGRPLAADPLLSGTAAFPPAAEGAAVRPHLQFAIHVSGLPVQRPGRVRFVVALAGDELGEVGVDVRLAPPPQSQPPPSAPA